MVRWQVPGKERTSVEGEVLGEEQMPGMGDVPKVRKILVVGEGFPQQVPAAKQEVAEAKEHEGCRPEESTHYEQAMTGQDWAHRAAATAEKRPSVLLENEYQAHPARQVCCLLSSHGVTA